jgi:hypothetical protein
MREDTFPDTIPYSFLLELVVNDPEVISELWAKPEGRERDEYTLGALRLGILALRQARSQIGAGAPALPHQDEPPLGDVQPALSETRSHAGEDTSAESAEDCLDVEPLPEEGFAASVPTGSDVAAVPSCYWLRRRRNRGRLV